MSSQSKKNPLDRRFQRLIRSITDLKARAALCELQTMLEEGVDPKLLLDCCMEGMRRVGVRFEQGTYYIAALIMAGDIMQSANTLLSPYLTSPPSVEGGGRILLGTIWGDIHNLGKDLFALLLQCHDIEVVDIGVDVSADAFLEQAKRVKPDIIGISCVLTACIEPLKQTVAYLQDSLPDPQPYIIVGGTCLDKRVAEDVGARYWASDAATGLGICRKLFREIRGAN